MLSFNKKILIVDDSKSFLMVLKQGLLKEGFIVLTAERGNEGFAVAKEEKPDLIISDIVMPDMDGIAMARKLREAKIDAPIIFLTDMGGLEYIGAASELAEGYIIKSEISIEEIVTKAKSKLNL